MSEMRRVTAICNGTVVDHIPAGKALQVMQMPVSYTHLTLPTILLV